jgi:hypothetical protein
MEISFKKLSLIAVAAAASLPMLAVPTLRITDNLGNSQTITDNVAGDLSATLGRVTWLGTVGAWDISVSTGSTKPFLGTAQTPIMNINSTATRIGNTDAGSLTFELFEDGFLANPFQAKLTGAVSSGNNSGTATLSSLLDQTNPFDPFTGSQYASTGGALAYNTTSDAVLSVTGNSISPLTPFSLTLKTVVTMVAGGANGTVNVNAALSAVPEPGFYGALAIGLSGLFAAVARRRTAAKE